MNIAIIGGGGYIGQNLIKKFIKDTDDSLFSFSPHAESVDYASNRVSAVNIDIFDTKVLSKALEDMDIVYYLVHMMAQKKYDFAEAEARAANSLVSAVTASKVSRIIYLGGLGNDSDKLSKHLESRHHTGELLRRSSVRVIEFRASMVIGAGSISYEIIANLVHKLPILTLPSWAKTYTQPIGLEDAINYLFSARNIAVHKNEIVEIGGPKAMSYAEVMKSYAAWKHTKALFVSLPIIPVTIAAWWLNIFTPPRHAKVGRAMVESLGNTMVVSNNRAKELFPEIIPKPIHDCYV